MHETGGFFRVGQHLIVVQFANCADTIFFTRFTGFERTEAAQFTFYGYADFVRHGNHFFGHFHVVGKIRRGFTVFTQRAVHHHRAKAQINRALADDGAGSVVLVHDQGNVGIRFSSGLNQVFDEVFTRVFASACAGLQNDRCADFIRSCHDGLYLLQIIDVEGGNAVAIGRSVVEQFAHGNECHSIFPNFFRNFVS